ncbi:MAG: VTT domain-containing protein [Candidatus Polarisedimenticolaceae bacterium]|nr:VTT domain-containing protein [Candidatus Polarisedimenticolaceae bacterium]
MTELLQQLLDWIALHPVWAGIVIFLVAMCESLAVIGMLVPGAAMMIGFGALISTGTLEFWPTCAWAIAGAIVGDGLSFMLGHHYREQLTRVWPFSRHPKSLERGIRFFQRYGGKSVVIGRFIGPTRAIIPMVAGMMGMPANRFLMANVFSALLWAPLYLLPGMVVGASLGLASEVGVRLVVLLLLLALLVWLLIWSVKRLFLLLHPRATLWVQAAFRWSQNHPRLKDLAAALADPQHPEARGLAILATLLVIATGLSALTLTAALTQHGLGIDQTLLQGIQSLRTPWADQLMIHFTRLADTPVIAALALGVLLFLIWQQQWQTIGYWLAAVAFGFLASLILKYSIQLPRPDIGISGLSPYGFPSSHTLRATVIFGFLSVVIARAITPLHRWLPYGLAALLVLLVAISRLYLGVHWFSDVIASLSLGLAWVTLLGIAYHRHTAVVTHWRGLALCAISLLTVAISLQTWNSHASDMSLYSPAVEKQRLNASDWLDHAWQQQPAFRNDIRGRRNHPFYLQYAGRLEGLKEKLMEKGWQPADELRWEDILKLLSPSLPLQALPVFPQVHDGRHEALTLVKPTTEDGRLVLRLWSSSTLLMPGQTELWVGNVTQQQRSHALALWHYAETSPDFLTPMDTLRSDSSNLPHKSIPPYLLLMETPAERVNPPPTLVQAGAQSPVDPAPAPP